MPVVNRNSDVASVADAQQLDSSYSDDTTLCYSPSTKVPRYIGFHSSDGFDMIYRTGWTLTHPKIARAALADAGFTLGLANDRACGFLYQQDVGAGFYYSGNLYGRLSIPGDNATAPAWNMTAFNEATAAIRQHPAVLEITLCFIPLMVIVLGVFGCYLGPCISEYRRIRQVDKRAARERKRAAQEAAARAAAASTYTTSSSSDISEKSLSKF